MDQLASLRIALNKAEARVQRLAAQTDTAKRERDEIETAIRVLERFANQGAKPVSSSSTSDNGQLIYGYVGYGPDNAMPPRGIIEKLNAGGHDLGDDLVRTQLWRMAKRGELENSDGRYWRPVNENADSNEFDGQDTGDFPDAVGAGAAANSGRVNELESSEKAERNPFRKREGWGVSSSPPASAADKALSRGWDDFDDDVPF